MAKKKVTTPEEEGVEPKNQDPTVPTSTSSEVTPEVEDETTKPAEAEQEAEATDEAISSTDEEPEAKPTTTTPDSEEATPTEQSGDKPAEAEQEAEATDEAIPSTDEVPEPKPTSTTPESEEATPSEQIGDEPTEEGGDPEATEKPAEGADTSGETPIEGDPEGGAARDGENREEYEDAAPSALSDIAHQVLRDYDLKVVFLTTDGTAFYGYSDALNYARTLADETVHHFFRTPPTDDELRQLLPHNLLPEHLQKTEEQ